jgi:hypothetical protein
VVVGVVNNRKRKKSNTRGKKGKKKKKSPQSNRNTMWKGRKRKKKVGGYVRKLKLQAMRTGRGKGFRNQTKNRSKSEWIHGMGRVRVE